MCKILFVYVRGALENMSYEFETKVSDTEVSSGGLSFPSATEDTLISLYICTCCGFGYGKPMGGHYHLARKL